MLDNFSLAPLPIEAEFQEPEPEIRVLETGDDFARIAIEPLPKGRAVTIGNPLRRILLSSIKGSAITQVRIDDVVHEYTAIRGVKEEVMDLLLNIKRIRIRSQSKRTGKMRLQVRGEGRVCAGDIATSADFEIVNPELHLATLDTEDSSLAIDFDVEHGTGYRAVQSEGGISPPPGVLPVDAIFSPVRKVNYNIGNTRVGQDLNYERLEMEIWTDGTITPVDAVRQAADDLSRNFHLFRSLSPSADAGDQGPSVPVSPEIYQTPIERLELSPRTLNCLKRAQINRVGEVLEMSDDDLLKIRNFGDKSLQELREKLAERGIGAYSRGSSALDGDGDWAPAGLLASAFAETDWAAGDDSEDEDDAPAAEADPDDESDYSEEEDS